MLASSTTKVVVQKVGLFLFFLQRFSSIIFFLYFMYLNNEIIYHTVVNVERFIDWGSMI